MLSERVSWKSAFVSACRPGTVQCCHVWKLYFRTRIARLPYTYSFDDPHFSNLSLRFHPITMAKRSNPSFLNSQRNEEYFSNAEALVRTLPTGSEYNGRSFEPSPGPQLYYADRVGHWVMIRGPIECCVWLSSPLHYPLRYADQQSSAKVIIFLSFLLPDRPTISPDPHRFANSFHTLVPIPLWGDSPRLTSWYHHPCGTNVSDELRL